MFAVFGSFANRSHASQAALVGNYSKIILNCDRAKMHLDGPRLQWCWAYLKRDLQALIDAPNNQVKRLGHDLMRQKGLLYCKSCNCSISPTPCEIEVIDEGCCLQAVVTEQRTATGTGLKSKSNTGNFSDLQPLFYQSENLRELIPERSV